jgi:cardiolipin synthase (CMP-forming)
LGKKKKRPGGFQMVWENRHCALFIYRLERLCLLKGIWGIENLYVSVTLLSITAAFMIYAFIRYAQIYFDIVRSDDPKYQIDLQEVMDRKKRK